MVTGGLERGSPGRDNSSRRLEYLLLLALVAFFIWRGLVPGWRSLQTDFSNYYLASRLYRQGYPLKHVYDWIWFQRQKDHAGVEQPLVSFIPNPLPCLLPFLPLASLSPLAAKRCWLAINLALLGGVILLLNAIVELGMRRVAIIAFLAVDALRTNFLYGQEHLLVAFLLALAAFFYFRGAPATAGAVLACGAALKIYPAFFLFYFLRKRQWRAVAGLVLCSLGLGLLALALFGFDTLRYYTLEILPRSLAGEVIDPYNIQWSSFTALLRRLFIFEPELNPHPLAHFPAAYALLQPLCQALLFVPALWLISSARVQPAREKLEWATYVVLILILSTSPAAYHFAALMVAGVLAANYLAPRGITLLLLALYALVCLPVHHVWPGPLTLFQTFQTYLRLGALTALWLLLLRLLARERPEGLRRGLASREATAFGILTIVLVAAGFASNLRHLSGQFANYATRLVVSENSAIAAGPAVAGGRVFFTAMARTKYAIASLDHGRVSELAFPPDAFHLTSSDSGEAWVELASAQSRVVRLKLGQLPWMGREARDQVESAGVEAEDAEQPAVSRDGKWLAFIRETRGRGQLWIKGLPPQTGAASSAVEWPVESGAREVLEASFFPDDRVVFAAQDGPSAALFALDPATRRVSPLTLPWESTRYPAVSPDGQWLAYSQAAKGSWRLWVMSLATGEKRRLTFGDCNSIAPAWFGDSKNLVYATDCGRGLGMTALCRIRAAP